MAQVPCFRTFVIDIQQQRLWYNNCDNQHPLNLVQVTQLKQLQYPLSKKNQPSVTNDVTLQRKCSPGRTETITTLITKMIALDMLPSYMVEGKGFRKLLSFLEPEYKVPSHQTITRRVSKMYGEVKEEMEKTLDEISDVAITTDAWTSLATESYVTVTFHFERLADEIYST